jgi:hypothetical protein
MGRTLPDLPVVAAVTGGQKHAFLPLYRGFLLPGLSHAAVTRPLRPFQAEKPPSGKAGRPIFQKSPSQKSRSQHAAAEIHIFFFAFF